MAAVSSSLAPSSYDGSIASSSFGRSSSLFGTRICGAWRCSDLSRRARCVAMADLGVNDKGPSGDDSGKSFMSDVSDLIKLVDSKDIIELELKNNDFEITIRKAEALLPPPAAPLPPQQSFLHLPPQSYAPQQPASPPPAAAPAAPASDAAAAPAAESAPAAPSHPPMLSPMAGTFYRAPGPGEPSFVKVGDRVKKGQVLCIIEAMKLMNDIECDQDGTLVEILVEDGKPVSADTPLFTIKP